MSQLNLNLDLALEVSRTVTKATLTHYWNVYTDANRITGEV